ncbi:DUF1648 domain-containing protein [Solwaraspora sp. WMMD1047]|uniref:DUF1648 domain-containing protein n=1 Tax=Solwaraspora sp. WMMD1047 TaxID=3016102 RepID=UPI002417B878|nr:DUF1648 domain-containing protein [Solwaraspora sp. WMMD1047]MDG4832784.1 DUF1648 domain-containing protein [Solwaraspora sp. WMMD1047]
MTNPRRWYALAAGWVGLVAASVVVAMLAAQDRMPDPLATHWGPGGVPDGRMPFGPALLAFVGLWGTVAALQLAILSRGGMLTHRAYRSGLAGMLAGTGIFLLGLAVTTIGANLDRATWRDARSIGPGQVAIVFALALAVGALAAVLARRGPHTDPAQPPSEPGPLPLAADEHTVWVSRVTNRYLVLAGALLLSAAVVMAAASWVALPRWWLPAVAVPLAVVAVAGALVASVRVEVDRRGLTIGYGPWAWPRRHFPLRDIVAGWSERRAPAQVGGWGYRGLPGGNTTLMVRSGACLVIRRRSGAEFAVSADDAEHGAALLDTLRRRHAEID